MALISKGIELYCLETPDGTELPLSSATTVTGLGKLVPNLQEIGELTPGGSSERDKIEITTLADDKHVFTLGLQAESSFDAISFKFLYDSAVYQALVTFAEAEQTELGNAIARGDAVDGLGSTWHVVIPAGVAQKDVFTIVGTCSVTFDGVGTNSALTMTLNITPTKEIEYKSKWTASAT